MVRKKIPYLSFSGGSVVKSNNKWKERVKLRIKGRKNQKGGVLAAALAASIGVLLLRNLIKKNI